jgi:putative restriction endonuclease
VFDAAYDARVRLAAFRWLEEQESLGGDILAREALARGFSFGGKRVPLVGPPGIFKPQVLREVPLSITTAPNGPTDRGS